MTGASPRLRVAEPPAQYLVKPPLVIDCSVLSAIVFDEPTKSAAEQSVAGRTLLAPVLLQFEIANVAVKKQRRGDADAAIAMELAMGTEIDYRRIDAEATAQLALRYGLSAYDAAYLWLAADLICPLATFDQRLADAAHAHLGALG